jgi:hypothetical protein
MTTLSIRISVVFLCFLGEEHALVGKLLLRPLGSYHIRISIKHGSCTLKEKLGAILTRLLLHDNLSDLMMNAQIKFYPVVSWRADLDNLFALQIGEHSWRVKLIFATPQGARKLLTLSLGAKNK